MTQVRTSRFLSNYLLEALKNGGARSIGELDTEVVFDPTTDAKVVWDEVGKAFGVSEPDLVAHVASYFRSSAANLSEIPPSVLQLVPPDIARKHRVCPVRQEDRTLFVATSDPTDIDAEKSLAFTSGRSVQFLVASPGDIQTALEVHYSDDRALEDVLAGVSRDDNLVVEVVEDIQPEAVAEEDTEAAPVIKLTNLILREAIDAGASDIHIEAHRTGGGVRYRVDGVLRHYMQLPKAAYTRVVSRVKILAKLDIADRLRPQDGRARVQMFGRTFDLRLSTVPTRFGEKAVLRILDPENVLDIANLGMTDIELRRFSSLLGYRNGLVIVTGPTGSGKTTTLYAGIAKIATPMINVTTVEDPVEYELKGVNQIQVETKQDLTFAAALRSVLRQDPDVIFVGEIRDAETAHIAIQGCMTGHLVLATLHTNDAIGVVARLKDLGVDKAALAATFRGAVAQRLIRRICPSCCETISGELTEAEARAATRYRVRPTTRAVGCKECGGSGYRGRLPVTEVATITNELEEAINNDAPASELTTAARRGGMRLLSESVLDLVRSGVTTLDEVERVLGEATRSVGAEESAETGGENVLVVEDDPVTRKVAVRLLKKEGFLVTEAGDGEEAVRIIERGTPLSLVITDLQMPKLDGRGVLAAIRGSLPTAMLPVMVLTASADPDIEEALMNEGANDYIRKPIDPANFVARIKGVLRRAEATR